jgi:cytochrome c
MLRKGTAVVCFLLATAPAIVLADQRDKEMERLAQAKGCNICHNPGSQASNDKLPMGPVWKDIAKKYKGQKGATDRLTRIIVAGSEPGAAGRHWKDQARGAAMPSNTISINEADARKLVQWILASDK